MLVNETSSSSHNKLLGKNFMSTNVILVVTSAISELERHIKWVGTWKFGIKGRAHTGLGAFVDMENYAGLNIQISARVTIKKQNVENSVNPAHKNVSCWYQDRCKRINCRYQHSQTQSCHFQEFCQNSQCQFVHYNQPFLGRKY